MHPPEGDTFARREGGAAPPPSAGIPAEPGRDLVERVLRERARALAQPLAAEEPIAEGVDFLAFSLGGERFAVAIGDVREVGPLPPLTPVPGTPPSILGVAMQRGQVVPVVDLRVLLGLLGHGVDTGLRIVVVHAAGATFGLLADTVDGIIRVAADRRSPPSALRADAPGWVSAVTAGLVALLDVASLAQDPGVRVNEEESRA